MIELRKRHISLINNISTKFQRSISTRLPWNERLLGIKGARGIGKTTLLLQYIKQNYKIEEHKALYMSLDDLFFYENKLIDLADLFVAGGGEHLFIDEVHKYPDWANEIKKIYDYHPKLKVVFTGSSLLEILNSRSDLSRRALVFSMQGMSFREFLLFKYNYNLPEFTLQNILSNHIEISLEIGKQIKPLYLFAEYLQIGYLPFAESDKEFYYKRIREIMNMILEIELPALRNVEVSKIPKIKELLYIISQSVPFKPNISALSEKIKISRNSLLEYIHGLSDAKILKIINKDSFGISLLQKPEKIFLENTNYIYAISRNNPDPGNIRETFFLNQLYAKHSVTYPERGDFLIDEQFLFEIGGRNKTFKQISGIENAFVASDNIEHGADKQIPLWLFGFLY